MIAATISSHWRSATRRGPVGAAGQEGADAADAAPRCARSSSAARHTQQKRRARVRGGTSRTQGRRPQLRHCQRRDAAASRICSGLQPCSVPSRRCASASCRLARGAVVQTEPFLRVAYTQKPDLLAGHWGAARMSIAAKATGKAAGRASRQQALGRHASQARSLLRVRPSLSDYLAVCRRPPSLLYLFPQAALLLFVNVHNAVCSTHATTTPNR